MCMEMPQPRLGYFAPKAVRAEGHTCAASASLTPGFIRTDGGDAPPPVRRLFCTEGGPLLHIDLAVGFLLVLLAALLQGSFVLPMTLVRQWSWEHTWATFPLLGMLIFNWIITLLFVPNIFAVYAASPGRDLAMLALFGLGWGVGAVLFGLGMDRLGM